MLIDALHAALEDRKETFDSVRVNIAAHVLASGMLDRQVFAEMSGRVA
jgi:hypothetical protein